MSSIMKNSIIDSLKNNEANKKSISIVLDYNTLEQIKIIQHEFNQINESKFFTRNMLIEEALKGYLKEAKIVLKEEYDIDIDNKCYSVDPEEFDTVIFSAHEEGFNSTFIAKKCWYSVKIHESRIDKIKHLALYQTAPVSAITHIAKVKSIESYQGTDKKIIYFDGEPIKLPNDVKIGDYKPISMRSARYTTKEKLLNSKEIKELF